MASFFDTKNAKLPFNSSIRAAGVGGKYKRDRSDVHRQANQQLSSTQIAQITNVNVITGIITCQWFTASNATNNLFEVKIFSQPRIGNIDSHFFGGMPAKGDFVEVETIKRDKGGTAYRIINTGVDPLYARHVKSGKFPTLQEGEQFIQSKGGTSTLWDEAGSFELRTGFKTPSQIEYEQEVKKGNLAFDPKIRHLRDYVKLWGKEKVNDTDFLRTFHSTINHTLVQWGKVNRFREGSNNQLIIERVHDSESEFLASILNDERTEELSSLFLGGGFTLKGEPILLKQTGGHAMGGFIFNKTSARRETIPKLLWDYAGRFELSDSFSNYIFTDDGHFHLKANGRFSLLADQKTSITTGESDERAKDKQEIYTKLKLYVDDVYDEVINGTHTITRNAEYSEIMTALGVDGTNTRTVEVNPSGISKFFMDLNKIEFGTDMSVSNIVLTTTEGKLGIDSIVAPISYKVSETKLGSSKSIGELVSKAEEFTIGSALAQAIMKMKATSLKIGTGAPIDVDFNVSGNQINHSVLNEFNATLNFFGANK